MHVGDYTTGPFCGDSTVDLRFREFQSLQKPLIFVFGDNDWTDCKRGGFVDAHADFDPLPFGVVPKASESVEPDQLLTLKVGYEALRDAGYEHKPFARERPLVICAMRVEIASSAAACSFGS